MTNLERMVQALITIELVAQIAAIFGVDEPTAEQVAALQALVANQFPIWEAAINLQTAILNEAQVSRSNLVRLRNNVAAGSINDPRLAAIDAALQAIDAAWPQPAQGGDV